VDPPGKMSMALVRIPERRKTIGDKDEVSTFLASYGITYERWESTRTVPSDASGEAVLQIYGDKIEELKARGGYTTADVIDVTPSTPNLDSSSKAAVCFMSIRPADRYSRSKSRPGI
jgi:1,2-dihydroxy-3-keto-5-methylthiopentene dioxygenase